MEAVFTEAPFHIFYIKNAVSLKNNLNADDIDISLPIQMFF